MLIVAHVLTVHLQIIITAHMLIKDRKFYDAAHSPQHLIGLGCKCLPEQFYTAKRRFPEIGQHLHHCRLTCTVGTQKSVDLTFLHMEIHICYKFLPTDRFGEMVSLYHKWHLFCPLSESNR